MSEENFEFDFKEEGDRKYCFANGETGSGDTWLEAMKDWSERHARTQAKMEELTSGPFLGQLRAHYCKNLGISTGEWHCAENHDGALFNGTAK